MIVEPTPTTPRSPVRRALRVVALVTPVVLLAGTVAVGLLGPRTEVPAPPAVATSPAASPAIAVAPAPTPEPSGTAAPARDIAPPGFGGLPVVPVAELAAAGGPDASTRAGGLVAASGILRLDDPSDEACPSAATDPLGPWCRRTAVLADWTWANGGPVAGAVPPHLHLVIPPGVRVPSVQGAPGPGVGVAPVVALGRIASTGDACPAARHACEDAFIVERFAWTGGIRVGLTPLIDDRLQTGRRRPNPFPVRVGEGEVPLAAVLTWPADLARLDPEAGRLAARGDPSQPVWYLRVAVPDGSPGAQGTGWAVRWTLLAEPDLAVIGSADARDTGG